MIWEEILFMRRSGRFPVVAGKCLDANAIVAKYDGGVPTYYLVDVKIAHCYSDKGMYRVREEVAFEHWLSRFTSSIPTILVEVCGTML